MKKLFFTAFAWLIGSSLMAQDFNVSGMQTYSPSGTPRIGSWIAIIANTNPNAYVDSTSLNSAALTGYVGWTSADVNGYYSHDIPGAGTPGTQYYIWVAYDSCNIWTVRSLDNNNGNTNSAVVNLETCTGCSASFFYYNSYSTSTINIFPATSFFDPNHTWTWDFGDGNTSNIPYATHTYANPGTYQVCLTVNDNAGCVSSYCRNITITQMADNGERSSYNLVVNEPPINLGLEQNETLSEMRVFPNPAENQVTVNITTETASELSVTVTDLSGRVVSENSYSSSMGENHFSFDTSSWATGTYAIRITNKVNGSFVNQLLIKQ